MKKLYFLFGLDMLCLALFLTMFQKHARLLGCSYFFMGLLNSFCAILSIFWKPVCGYLSDKLGCKKVLVWVLVLSAAGHVLTMLSTNKWYFLLVRMGCSISTTVQPTLRSFVTDLVGLDESVSVFNKIGAVFGLSFMGGSLIGGQLAESENAVTYTYLFMFFIGVVNVVIGITLPNTNKAEAPKTNHGQDSNGISRDIITAFKNLRRIAVSDKYWVILSVKATKDTCQAFTIANIRLILVSVVGLSESHVSYFVVVMMVCSIATNLSLSKMKQAFYRSDDGSRRIQHATMIGAVVSVLMTFAPSTVVVLYHLQTMSSVVMDSTLMEALLGRVGEHEKGMVMSSYETVTNVVDIIIPPIAGFLADSIGVRLSMLCTALSFFVGNRLSARYLKNNLD